MGKWSQQGSSGGGSLNVTLGKEAGAQSKEEATGWTQYTYETELREKQVNLGKNETP